MDFGAFKQQESTSLLLVTLAVAFSEQLQRTSHRVGGEVQFRAVFDRNHVTLVW
jgi:hypothetical protein